MKIIFNLLQKMRKIYWKTFNIKTKGVRILLYRGERILLVKHRYGNYWVFPGGGINKKETPENAARREALEECCVNVKSFEKTFGIYKNNSGGKNDEVTLFTTKDWEDRGFRPTFEIKDCRLFHLDRLPRAISEPTKKRIDEFFKQGRKTLVVGKW